MSGHVEQRDAELPTLVSQIVQALSIIQGSVLLHSSTRRYLGRRYALEVSRFVYVESSAYQTFTRLSDLD